MKVAGLRIALFSGNYNYVKDGANQALNKLVAYLEQHGAIVRVYSPTVESPAFEPAGTLISVPSIAIPRRKEYRLALGLPGYIQDDITAFAPHLFHLSAPDWLGCRALGLARKLNVPVVASVHTRFESYLRYYGLSWLEGPLKSYFRSFYRRCQQIYAPSDSMAAQLRSDGMSDDIRIWGRGIDAELFTPERRDMTWRRAHGFADEDVVVSFVGRLVREKGLAAFSSIMGRIAAQGIRHKVLVIGDGPERAWFERQMPQAIFTGFLTGESLARGYASSDIFLNPSETETFGNVTLEAMASGLPVVGARATGSSSLVSHGETGFLSAPGNQDGMMRNVTLLIQSDALRKRQGQAAREAAVGQSWEQILQSLTHHYLAALAAPSRIRHTATGARMVYPAARPDFSRDVTEPGS